MSKRLQVLIDERELDESRGLAQRERLTVADWVRRALDEAKRRRASGDAVEKAKDILLQTQGLSARDSLHMAVMQRRRVADIMTFDRGFSGLPGIRIVGR
jgi:predicted nucleic acid-binding protein